MPFLADREWNGLIDTIRAQRCILVLGPDVSHVGNNSSETMAQQLTKHLASEIVGIRDTTDPHHVAQQFAKPPPAQPGRPGGRGNAVP